MADVIYPNFIPTADSYYNVLFYGHFKSNLVPYLSGVVNPVPGDLPCRIHF